MCFFRKKTKAEKNTNDREMIEANSKQVDTLLVVAVDDGVKEELKKLQEQIRYTTALPESKALDYDKKIKNALDDLKVELVKGKDDEKATAKINSLIRDLKLLVAERKALI